MSILASRACGMVSRTWHNGPVRPAMKSPSSFPSLKHGISQMPIRQITPLPLSPLIHTMRAMFTLASSRETKALAFSCANRRIDQSLQDWKQVCASDEVVSNPQGYYGVATYHEASKRFCIAHTGVLPFEKHLSDAFKFYQFAKESAKAGDPVEIMHTGVGKIGSSIASSAAVHFQNPCHVFEGDTINLSLFSQPFRNVRIKQREFSLTWKTPKIATARLELLCHDEKTSLINSQPEENSTPLTPHEFDIFEDQLPDPNESKLPIGWTVLTQSKQEFKVDDSYCGIGLIHSETGQLLIIHGGLEPSENLLQSAELFLQLAAKKGDLAPFANPKIAHIGKGLTGGDIALKVAKKNFCSAYVSKTQIFHIYTLYSEFRDLDQFNVKMIEYHPNLTGELKLIIHFEGNRKSQP